MPSVMGKEIRSGSYESVADTLLHRRFGAVLVEDVFESILKRVLATDGA